LLAICVSLVAGAKGQRKELFMVVLAFSVLGIVTGYLTGFSREPAISAVLPAVLSLMGGLMIFLVGRNQESRGIVSISMFVFSFMLLMGAGWGAVMRDVSEEYKKSEIYLKQQAFIESEVNEFRKNLGLGPLETKSEKLK
jgi:predicted neutral ceramidase superfamily lipid hydrolase